MRRAFCWLLLIAGIVGVAAVIRRPGEPAVPARPKLAVLIVFDQMRADYLTRWHDLYETNGFRRLAEQGAWFQNCHYPFANTVTGAGHATLATGCPPSVHGIVSNEWYDPARGFVNCVRDPAAEPDPVRLRVPTLGDTLLMQTGGKGRTVSLSLKDRSALLMAGKEKNHFCCWHDIDKKSLNIGNFIRASRYYDKVSANSEKWLAEFNLGKGEAGGRVADHWWNTSAMWEHLYPKDELDYAALSRKLPAGVSWPFPKGYAEFPHPLRLDPDEANDSKPTPRYYEAIHVSPFGNNLLLALAKKAVVAERLGQRGEPDLLCVSFSSNDLVGHVWGPDSEEVLDMTLRTDLLVRDLLAFLDTTVGRGGYTVCLTSDHGVCPFPEISRTSRRSRRVAPKDILQKASQYLKATYKTGEKDAQPLADYPKETAKWERSFCGWLYLNDTWLAAVRPANENAAIWKAKVAENLATAMKAEPEFQDAFTRADLKPPEDGDASLRAKVSRSFVPDEKNDIRCGDVFLVARPNFLVMKQGPLFNTTHGSPHDYDTHVPLLVYGPGIRAGVRMERVTPLAVPAILARALGIKPPDPCKTPVPVGLFTPFAE